jgi:hypothetical protein
VYGQSSARARQVRTEGSAKIKDIRGKHQRRQL